MHDVPYKNKNIHIGPNHPPNVSGFLGYFILFRITSKVLTLSTPNLVDEEKTNC